MKKNYLFGMLALAAMTMVGCSNDEVVNDYSQDNAIQFGTYVGRDAGTRVAETTTATLQASKEGFGVFAHYDEGGVTGTTPDFMNNQQVTYTGNAWTYAPVKYWPNNTADKITFWAYAPYSAKNDNQALTTPTFKITDGTDFVAMAQTVQSGKQAVDDKVLFTFSHMMSRIGFKVEAIIDELEHEKGDDGKEDEDNGDDGDATNPIANKTQIVVTKVTLNGALDQEGVMTWTNNDWVLSTTDATTAKDYVLEANNFAAKNSYTYEWDYDNNAAKSSIAGQLATIDKAVLNNTDSYLMFIPQTVSDMKITVEYYVITEDGKLATGYSKVINTIESDPFDFKFERGHAYNFVLHLGLTSVKFDVEVSTEWEENDHIVNVPINFKKQP